MSLVCTVCMEEVDQCTWCRRPFSPGRRVLCQEVQHQLFHFCSTECLRRWRRRYLRLTAGEVVEVSEDEP